MSNLITDQKTFTTNALLYNSDGNTLNPLTDTITTTTPDVLTSLRNDTWFLIESTAAALAATITTATGGGTMSNSTTTTTTSSSSSGNGGGGSVALHNPIVSSLLETFVNVTTSITNATPDSSLATSTETPYVPYVMRPETYIVPVLFAFIFIVGVLGNGTLILVFLTVRQMRNVPNT